MLSPGPFVYNDWVTEQWFLYYRNLSAIQDREICCYSISCKEKENIGKYINQW